MSLASPTSKAPMDWTPPSIESLDFASDCSLVADFYSTWFETLAEPDVTLVKPPHGDVNITHWIPRTIGADIVEKYFRAALPPNTQNVPSYGQILEWELQLRLNYSQEVQAWLDIEDFSKRHEARLNVTYFNVVVDIPGRLCSEQVCSAGGFEWERLSDLNGPGIYAAYIIQGVVASMFVLFALFETGQVYTGRIPKSQPTLSKPSLREHLYASVKQSFDGFSDSVGVFTLALPFSILAEFFSREDGVQYKDFRVAGWVLAYIMSLAVWLYRIGRLFRRVDTYRLVGSSDLSTDKKVKKEFTLLLLAVSSFPGLFFLFFLVVISLVFRFEDFWDDICGFSYKSDEIWLAVVAFVLILWCVLREFILAIGAELTKRRIRQRQTVAQAPQPTIARVFSVLDKRVRADPKYQTWALVLGLVDAIVVGVWTWIIFYRYNHYRRQLLDYANSGNKNTWSLGQVFALASVIPIGIGFLRGMCPLIWYYKDRIILSARRWLDDTIPKRFVILVFAPWVF
ncbi:hypothetical protein SAPIO_CDS9983 [Scedosporium apiospermum]|uniref:Uncharacterized protein n=1 Tax=Pseudallescheria apiosperma TaxID=563466 RepID=A0A084FW38_PSEDA|nr:uncharacterized protein SAPIO_CDS9983 [Scedosporium apiospermum]KEZ39300.1 hypothetical protein SAPIO_CDS9983 [Scedosporium apiospermum]